MLAWSNLFLQYSTISWLSIQNYLWLYLLSLTPINCDKFGGGRTPRKLRQNVQINVYLNLIISFFSYLLPKVPSVMLSNVKLKYKVLK